MHTKETTHRALILDQFTRQAQPFAAVGSHSAEDSLHLLAETLQISAQDEVLDVACGPGIVSCWLAQRAQHVTGTDLVPAMLDEARKRQAAAALENLQWSFADATRLPFADDSFTCVVTRYSFHHLLDPQQVLHEMARVCRPGGRIAVADVTPDEGKTADYDALETLRDPSHTHALSLNNLLALGAAEKLLLLSTASYRLEVPLETQLAASFPAPGNADKVREMVRRDLGVDRLSTDAMDKNGELMLHLPISIVVWSKP
ncbi:class I SAM-dependent methyltransferase [Telmatobacter bradus]|uniref:class I SAM-dependent methyltransferase n=1 Tax=Telmatobacter bradus TaxID=474953 RepID=UPI003B433F41